MGALHTRGVHTGGQSAKFCRGLSSSPSPSPPEPLVVPRADSEALLPEPRIALTARGRRASRRSPSSCKTQCAPPRGNATGRPSAPSPPQPFPSGRPLAAAQRHRRAPPAVAPMTANHFNAICSFLSSFQGFRKLIDATRRAGKCESRGGWRASQPEQALLTCAQRGGGRVVDPFPGPAGGSASPAQGVWLPHQRFIAGHIRPHQAPGSCQPCALPGLTTARDKDTARTNRRYPLGRSLCKAGCRAEGRRGLAGPGSTPPIAEATLLRLLPSLDGSPAPHAQLLSFRPATAQEQLPRGGSPRGVPATRRPQS